MTAHNNSWQFAMNWEDHPSTSLPPQSDMVSLGDQDALFRYMQLPAQPSFAVGYDMQIESSSAENETYAPW